MKKKKFALILCVLISSSIFSGCSIFNKSGGNALSFEDSTNKKLNLLRQSSLDLEQRVKALEDEMKIVQENVKTPNQNTLKDKDLIFSSVKISTKNAKLVNNVKYLVSDSKFDLKIDVTNATDKEINNYTCQAVLKYYNGSTLTDIYQTESKFDSMPKSVRKNIELKDFPVLKAAQKHELTIRIKDDKGSIIKTYTKILGVQ